MTRNDLAKIIWETSRADESTISATGANIIADALLDGPINELLRQTRAEAWAEGWHAYLQRKKLVDDNPYRDKPSKDGED